MKVKKQILVFVCFLLMFNIFYIESKYSNFSFNDEDLEEMTAHPNEITDNLKNNDNKEFNNYINTYHKKHNKKELDLDENKNEEEFDNKTTDIEEDEMSDQNLENKYKVDKKINRKKSNNNSDKTDFYLKKILNTIYHNNKNTKKDVIGIDEVNKAKDVISFDDIKKDNVNKNMDEDENVNDNTEDDEENNEELDSEDNNVHSLFETKKTKIEEKKEKNQEEEYDYQNTTNLTNFNEKNSKMIPKKNIHDEIYKNDVDTTYMYENEKKEDKDEDEILVNAINKDEGDDKDYENKIEFQNKKKFSKKEKESIIDNEITDNREELQEKQIMENTKTIYAGDEQKIKEYNDIVNKENQKKHSNFFEPEEIQTGHLKDLNLKETIKKELNKYFLNHHIDHKKNLHKRLKGKKQEINREFPNDKKIIKKTGNLKKSILKTKILVEKPKEEKDKSLLFKIISEVLIKKSKLKIEKEKQEFIKDMTYKFYKNLKDNLEKIKA